MTAENWRAELARAREQRTDSDPERRAWDKKWREWWWRGRERGATPNRAVSFAYRMTRDQLDARPGPYPDGSNAQEDS